MERVLGIDIHPDAVDQFGARPFRNRNYYNSGNAGTGVAPRFQAPLPAPGDKPVGQRRTREEFVNV